MLVSIIMPAFNASKTIFDSINSVQSQTYQNWEMIIIDDGSTDNTKDIITPFLSDYRIKYLRQLNSGPSIARNNGINKAKGKYLAFLDSDDIWKPNKLELQLNHFIRNPNCCLIHTNYSTFESNTQNSKPFRQTPWFSNWDENERLLMFDTIGTLTVLTETQLIKNLGGFNNDLHGTEDWDLWIRVSKEGKIFKLNDDTAYYRIHPHGISQSFDKHLVELDKVYNQHVFQPKIQNKIKYAANSVYSFRKAKNFLKNKNYLFFLRYICLGFCFWFIASIKHFKNLI